MSGAPARVIVQAVCGGLFVSTGGLITRLAEALFEAAGEPADLYAEQAIESATIDNAIRTNDFIISYDATVKMRTLIRSPRAAEENRQPDQIELAVV